MKVYGERHLLFNARGLALLIIWNWSVDWHERAINSNVHEFCYLIFYCLAITSWYLWILSLFALLLWQSDFYIYLIINRLVCSVFVSGTHIPRFSIKNYFTKSFIWKFFGKYTYCLSLYADPYERSEIDLPIDMSE